MNFYGIKFIYKSKAKFSKIHAHYQIMNQNSREFFCTPGYASNNELYMKPELFVISVWKQKISEQTSYRRYDCLLMIAYIII